MRQRLKDTLTELVTEPEASVLFGFKPGYLRLKVHRGGLEAIKKGTVWLYDKQDLAQLLRHRKR